MMSFMFCSGDLFTGLRIPFDIHDLIITWEGLVWLRCLEFWV